MAIAVHPAAGSPSRHRGWTLRDSVLASATLPVALLLGTASRPLWLDEAASATLAELPADSFQRVLLDREGNGLLHTVLLRAWQALGLGEAATRVLSVLAGLVALVLLALLADRLLGRRVAVIVPPLLVTNPLFVRYVVEARAYTLVLALVCGSGLLLVRALQRQSVASWCAYALVLGAAVYAHYFALLIVVAHGLAVLLRRPLVRIVPVLPAALLYLVVIAGLPRLMTDEAASGVGFLADSPFARALVVAVPAVLAVAGLGVLLLVARRLRRGRPVPLRSGKRGWPYVLLVSWLVVPLVLAVLVSILRSPVLAPRYLLVCLPPAVLILAALLARLRPVVERAAVAVVAVLGLVLGVVYLYDQTEEWDVAAALVQERARPGDEVLFVAPYVRIPFERQWDVSQARAQGVEPAYPQIPWGADTADLFFSVPLPASAVAAATADARRVFVVVSHVDLFDTGDPAYRRAAQGLRPTFTLAESVQLRGVRVETWVAASS